MTLLGDWNWWLPRWLEWLPRVTREPDVGPVVPMPAPLEPDPVPEPPAV
jgi:putative drug exporter of the RND superfamily